MKKILYLSFLVLYGTIAAQNTGINTTAPKTTLDVDGNIRAVLPQSGAAVTYDGELVTYTPTGTVVADANGVLGFAPTLASTPTSITLTGSSAADTGITLNDPKIDPVNYNTFIYRNGILLSTIVNGYTYYETVTIEKGSIKVDVPNSVTSDTSQLGLVDNYVINLIKK